jgi:hypothetical protein
MSGGGAGVGAGAGASADSGADASADADTGADADAGAEGAEAVDLGGSVVVAVSLRVQAAKTSATQADQIESDGLTDRQPKAAFVLGEHSIVSLLTIRVPSGAVRGRMASFPRVRGVQGPA